MGEFPGKSQGGTPSHFVVYKLMIKLYAVNCRFELSEDPVQLCQTAIVLRYTLEVGVHHQFRAGGAAWSGGKVSSTVVFSHLYCHFGSHHMPPVYSYALCTYQSAILTHFYAPSQALHYSIMVLFIGLLQDI